MTNTRKRVVVAMSGGVDSSVAAALLAERGYDVTGVMLRLWAEEGPGVENRCCSPQAVDDARRVCQTLDIPFYLLNVERPFKRFVVDYFCDEYAAGRTPNPCLMCNRHVRFGFLLNQALAMGADYLATGHYARIRRTDGRFQLLRAVDRAKDQSYVLYMLGQRELAHLLFPVGDYTKLQVRQMAHRWGLPVADKAESQEICFLADGDYRRFLQERIPDAIRPGPILDVAGEVVGQHRGLPLYTIGQRHGLGVVLGERVYVLEKGGDDNALVVGTREHLARRELTARDVSFVAGQAPEEPLAVTAKIRYTAADVPATIYALDNARARVVFDESQEAITPGQGVVFYQGEVCLGGGIIEEEGTNQRELRELQRELRELCQRELRELCQRELRELQGELRELSELLIMRFSVP